MHAEHPGYPFDSAEQIQPCSIDLRLSNVFWKPRRRSHLLRRALRRGVTIDLRRSHLQEIAPRRDWKKIELADGQSLTIPPGRVLLARIYERFSVPPAYAGKIEGRSSFARLGLSVHCTGDFINPGWAGFMPLQLYNASPFPIRILPYLPICQLMLVKLSSTPSHTYGDQQLRSKYVNDDGGPSYWWRDRRVKEIHQRLGQVQVPEQIQNEIIERVRFKDADLLDRFQRFVGTRPSGQVQNADEILEDFSKREDRRRWWDRAAALPFGLGAPTSLGSLFVMPFGLEHYIIWGVTAAGILPALYAANRRDAEYLGRRELVQARPAPMS
jgi:deoxycytidine triphosphate deaminase